MLQGRGQRKRSKPSHFCCQQQRRGRAQEAEGNRAPCPYQVRSDSSRGAISKHGCHVSSGTAGEELRHQIFFETHEVSVEPVAFRPLGSAPFYRVFL